MISIRIKLCVRCANSKIISHCCHRQTNLNYEFIENKTIEITSNGPIKVQKKKKIIYFYKEFGKWTVYFLFWVNRHCVKIRVIKFIFGYVILLNIQNMSLFLILFEINEKLKFWFKQFKRVTRLNFCFSWINSSTVSTQLIVSNLIHVSFWLLILTQFTSGLVESLSLCVFVCSFFLYYYYSQSILCISQIQNLSAN